MFLLYYPLKQGLKLRQVETTLRSTGVFTLLSIKTRIDTAIASGDSECGWQFISYYPLKQGLKLTCSYVEAVYFKLFISYYPLKQGLKLAKKESSITRNDVFISYYPLKQGLKRMLPYLSTMRCAIYILLSIKTRIETPQRCQQVSPAIVFISYYPLKQGLKLSPVITEDDPSSEFISYYPLKQGLKLDTQKLAIR